MQINNCAIPSGKTNWELACLDHWKTAEIVKGYRFPESHCHTVAVSLNIQIQMKGSPLCVRVCV